MSGLLLLLGLPGASARQEIAEARASRVEAAFLRNFARYVTWPESAFSDGRSPWSVCVLGSDPFSEALERTLEGRSEQGRTFEIHRAATLDRLPRCHIVFVALADAAARRAALSELAGRPVLTIGDSPGFLEDGGIVQFLVGDHVEMSINLDQARAGSLKIQTKLLEVSREVVENGMRRRR